MRISSQKGSLRIPPEEVKDLHETGKPVWLEEQRDGRWFETAMYPIADRSGVISRIVIHSYDITDWKQLVADLKKEGLSQIEHNMEQFQILNDHIRNPLQVIRGYISLMEDRDSTKIEKQIAIIDNLVTQLDKGWVESEKVRSFLIRHYRHGEQIMPKHRNIDNH